MAGTMKNLYDCIFEAVEDILNAKHQEDLGMRVYFDMHGVEHSLEDCPQDDTCECPEHLGYSEAVRDTQRAISTYHDMVRMIKLKMKENPKILDGECE
jgi:hypothetical protein